MPTIIRMNGWRVYVYMNEGREPIHVHAAKGEAIGKYWLLPDELDIQTAYEYNFSPALRREIRRILFDNFNLILKVWEA